MNAPYARMFFVCTYGKTCPTQGSEAVHAALKEACLAAGLGDAVRVNKSGCFAQCGHGPMIAVFPEGRWYAAVRAEDVAEIVETDLRGGRPVERLLHRPARPGKNVCTPGDVPGTIAPFVVPGPAGGRAKP
jgi:(2Fe-2S) ferredoxin